MCVPCRDAKKKDCKLVKGKDYCKNCEDHPESCVFPSGEQETPVDFRTGNDYDEDAAMRWDQPLRADEIEHLMKELKAGRADADIAGKHLVQIGCARKSSHPGALGMNQVAQNLLISMQTHINVLQNPHDQQSPEVGMHLAGLPVQR